MKALSNVKKGSFSDIIARNRQFDLEKVEEFMAGIVLTGNEIKSVRLRNVSIKEAYALVRNGEMFIFNMHIASYHNANSTTNESFDTTRKRKLLLKKSEIRKFSKFTREKGLVIVPTKLFISQNGWAKLQLQLSKKLRKYQIKSKLRERDLRRQMYDGEF